MGKKRRAMDRLMIIIIGLISGACVCRLAYGFWHFKEYPELYSAQSAPWYLDEMLWGVLAGAAVIIALIIKICIRKKGRQ